MKKRFVALSTTIMIMGSAFSVTGVKADTKTEIESNINETKQEINSLQAERNNVQAQIDRLNQAINDNNAKMNETNQQIGATQAEVDELKSEIAIIQARIDQRGEVLKERAVSFQENGGQVSYLNVILGSSSFSDFVDRLSAVATIVEADKGILEEHEADKNELAEYQASVENKLSDLNNMKTELEGMQAQINEQKAQSEALAAQVQQDLQASTAELNNLEQQKASLEAAARAAAAAKIQTSTSAPTSTSGSNKSVSNGSSTTTSVTVPSTNSGSGSLSDVINAGYKYIGNSVYVFGGGRSQSDIAAGRFDCSGFVAWAFSTAGIKLPASTDALKNSGTRVSTSEMRPGDLVFFNTYKTDGHVGIYIGGGQFIGSQSSTGVAVANMSSGYWANTFNGRVVRIR